MGLLSWIVVGLIAGALAQVVTRTKSQGCLGTMLIGILGAIVGGFLFNAIGEEGLEQGGLWSVFVAFVGSSVLLLVFDGRIGRR